MTTDTLEDFILHGDAREVDRFWAAKGRDWKTICQCDEPLIQMGLRCNNCLGYRALDYTDPNAHPRLIEDRVKELGHFWEYLDELNHLYLIDEISKDYGVTGFALGATNRQRILAAARAMGLER